MTASPSLPSGAKPNFQPYKSTSPPPPPPPPPSTQPSTSTSTSPRTSNGNKNHHNRHQSNHSDYDNDHPQLSLPNGKNQISSTITITIRNFLLYHLIHQ